ncbi:AMP-binding protein [Nocardioides speluncae]|uniref:AMP-binding protein n=1 Tax=Nocardioides speluncae TaxID=2670337 RepID=UPI00137A7202|nr:AMP-binding protein [Nocardioides speluncae]
MDLTWFRQPGDGRSGSLNLCFNAVDRHVVHGAAEEPALLLTDGSVDFANLLERVGALAGAFRALGVGVGDRVVLALTDPQDVVVAELACARLGAVYAAALAADLAAVVDLYQPVLVATAHPPVFGAHTPSVCLVRGVEPVDLRRDLDWEAALAAGRTDAAPCAEVGPDATAYSVAGSDVVVRDAFDQATPPGQRLERLASRTPLDLTGGTT